MQIQIKKQVIFEELGDLLEYPLYDFREELLEISEHVESISSSAADRLKDFYSRMKRMELEMWQEFYVQTFDLTPVCSLYISVHLFGEESFKRAELMAGLKKVYEKNYQGSSTELPDHLAVILGNNALFSKEEWQELVKMCLLPAIPSMIKKLEAAQNPYSLILKTVQELLAEGDITHA